MGAYILRRLAQSVLTVVGVMIVTFLLFRGIAGDIASPHVGARATEQQKADWRHRYGYDRPLLLNLHRRLLVTDLTDGRGSFTVNAEAGTVADSLALIPMEEPAGGEAGRFSRTRMGRHVWQLSGDTAARELTGGKALVDDKHQRAEIRFVLADASTLTVDLFGAETAGAVIARINRHPENGGRVKAGISTWRMRDLLKSQFVDHLVKSATFQSRSLRNNQKLTEIIVERAPASLAITVPSLAIGWFLAMIISCLVAYYRGSLLDRAGVFLSVLGMCIPYLAFMIYGQWLMFAIAPRHAYGVFYRANVYVPIAITVIAGLGGSVRFYRTVILDEVHRDYVRTARAKGAPLTSVLFQHVLKNCMLPILTSLVLAIPFLMMGNLLAERYFGIPGLGDLLLSSINGYDEPILNGLVFLTALIYTVGLLVTDISYAVFDPRIRLQ